VRPGYPNMQAFRNIQEINEDVEEGEPLMVHPASRDMQEIDVEEVGQPLVVHPTIEKRFHSSKRNRYIFFGIGMVISLIGILTTALLIALKVEIRISIYFLTLSCISFLVIPIYFIGSKREVKKISEFNKRPIAHWTYTKEEWKIFVEDEFGRNGRIRSLRTSCTVLKPCIIGGIIATSKCLTITLQYFYKYEDLELLAKSIGIPTYALLILIFISSFVFFALFIRFIIFVKDEIMYCNAKCSKAWEVIIIPNGVYFDNLYVWTDKNFNDWKEFGCSCNCSPFDYLTSVGLIDLNVIEFSLLMYANNPTKYVLRIPIPIGRMEEAIHVVGILSKCCKFKE